MLSTEPSVFSVALEPGSSHLESFPLETSISKGELLSPKLQRDWKYFRKYLHPKRVGGTKDRPDIPLGHTGPSPTSQGSNSPVSGPSSLQRLRDLKGVGYLRGTPLGGQFQSLYRFFSVCRSRFDPPPQPKWDRDQGSTRHNAYFFHTLPPPRVALL